MNRKTLFALLLFFVLSGAVYFLSSQPEKGERVGERPRPISRISGKTIQKVSITAKGNTVVLERRGEDSWELVKPLRYPADKYAVRTMAEKLEKLEFGDIVTEIESKQAEYEVDDKGGMKVVVSDGKQDLAEFYLGKTIDRFTMFRAKGSKQIYQAVGSLGPSFRRDVKGWRERKFLEMKRDEVRKLSISSEQGIITLTRPDAKGQWKVESAPLPIDLLDQGTANNLLSALSSLSAADFADGVSPGKSGLDQPRYTITAGLSAAGKELTLLVGKMAGDSYHVQRKGKPQIFLINKHSLKNLLRRPIDFKDKVVLSFKADDLESLKVTSSKDKGSITFKRKGDGWTGNGKKIADANKIKDAVKALATLKAEGFGAFSPVEYGLDKPDWILEIMLKDHTRHLIKVGSQEKDSLFALTRSGSPDIFTLRKYMVDKLRISPKGFK